MGKYRIMCHIMFNVNCISCTIGHDSTQCTSCSVCFQRPRHGFNHPLRCIGISLQHYWETMKHRNGRHIYILNIQIYQHSLFAFMFPFAFQCHLSSNARPFSTGASGLLQLGIYHQVKGKRVDFRTELELKILTKYN